jgi:hypothetical protein
MPKFVFIYHAPSTPQDAAPPTPEQMEAVMGAWNDWAASVGDGLVDFGTPLAAGSRVSSDGTTAPSERDVVGYTILEADSHQAPVDLAKAHPHLHMPGGCEIEIHQTQPIPGM